jgi:uncharacterized protein YbjT (DUF2867 family)
MFVIAGVTGHVGAVAANELLGKKEKIKVLVRDAKKAEPWSRRGAEVAVGSLEDQAFLTGALRGATGFFVLLPPNYAVTSPAEFYGYQRKTADAIAGAVKAAGVPHVVLLSSIGADLPDGTGPIKGLHYAENVLRGTGAVLTAIRAGYFQENLGGTAAAAKQQGIFPNFTPSADYPMPMINTNDIGRLAAESLLAKPRQSEAVDLQGPKYSQRELAQKLGAALGKELRIIDIPQAEWITALTKGGVPPAVAEIYAEMYGAFAKGIIKPCGDRFVEGKTPIDEVVRSLASA